MSNHDVPSRAPDERLADINSARAQFEAALQRRRSLGQESVRPEVPGYSIIREIHRGGQGTVFLAVQESTGRRVAIKILARAVSPRSRATGFARFEREVEALSVLKHPNVVTIHDCGRDRDHVYLVMDYVDGRPLDAPPKRSVPETLAIFAKVCDAVNAAHLRGVIHRDLKPANILVDDRGEPHVVDFGLAKLADDRSGDPPERAMTATGEFVGSLPWASPEQAEGRADELDLRTDVYSLGVVLYQVLTGRFPYPVSGRLSEVVRHISHTEPTRPSTFSRGVDRELETILLKCLAKEPDRRYQTAGDLARDLRRLLAGEPIEARRDSLAYVMTKQLHRYRVAAMGAGATLLVLAVALTVSIALWQSASRQRTIAVRNAQSATESARRASDEASQARAVVEFLRSVLTSVEPENQGADVTLMSVLADAARSAPENLGAHPAQEAQVRDLLGQIYYKLSLWPESRAQFTRAAELWIRAAGPDDPRTLQSRINLMRAMLSSSLAAPCEELLADLLPRLQRVAGPDDPLTLEARRGFAVTRLLRGRDEEAESLLLELRANPHLANDEAQVRILGGLVGVYTSRLNTEGPRRSEALLKAEPFVLEWVERSERLSGPASPLTLHALGKWADIAGNLGRFEDAAGACRRILDGSSGRLGECHIVRVNAMYTLAEALARLGQSEEPADLMYRAVECARAHNEPGSPAVLGMMGDALRYLHRAGRATQGEAMARELAESLRSLGPEHGDISHMAEMYVAEFASMQGRLDEAESLFAPLLSRADRITDPRVRARLLALYANHLTRRADFPRAEETLAAASALLPDLKRGTWDSHPDDVILSYIALYEAWGKPDRAAGYERLRQEVSPSH